MTDQLLLPAGKEIDVDKMLEAFDGNAELLLFYVTWLKHGMNATEAYQELHPNVTYGSARVLGSTHLARINKEIILQSYGLDLDLYMKQLKEGLSATKWNDFTGEREPDHKTRKEYHDKLGKLIGMEQDKATVLQQFNAEKIEIISYKDK